MRPDAVDSHGGGVVAGRGARWPHTVAASAVGFIGVGIIVLSIVLAPMWPAGITQIQGNTGGCYVPSCSKRLAHGVQPGRARLSGEHFKWRPVERFCVYQSHGSSTSAQVGG